MSKSDRLDKVEKALVPEKSILFLEQDYQDKNLYHTNGHPCSWREDEPPDTVYTSEELEALRAGGEYGMIIVFREIDISGEAGNVQE